MQSRNYIKDLLVRFDTLFPEDWLTIIEKNEDRNKLIKEFLANIDELYTFSLECLGKLVLSGDFLLGDSDLDDNLRKLAEMKWNEDGLSIENTELQMLQSKYSTLLSDLSVSVNCVRSHICDVKNRFKPKHKDEISPNFSFNRINSAHHSFTQIVCLICYVCWLEYILSYSENSIGDLIVLRQQLIDLKKTANETIIEMAILKCELMLYKLKEFSNGRKITFDYNADHFELKPLEDAVGKVAEFKENFHDFIDVSRIDELKLVALLADLDGDSVDMWRIVILMRCYTKSLHKDDSRVNNLLGLAERHYMESLNTDKNLVDRYSDLTFVNYLYNCRFSYFCSKERGYSFADMRSDLRAITELQKKTSIYNYHPYQKAFEFTYNLLKRDMDNMTKSEEIKEHMFFLEDCYKQFKQNLTWCKRYQPYLLQLRFNYSVVEDAERGFRLFCPSSFMRPIRFDILQEDLIDYQMKVATFHGRLELLGDRNQLKGFENKIKDVEKHSFERMAFFSTVVIFLVGLISIFTGNSKSVSLIDKMQYVSVLGVILLLFLCLGYFITAGLSTKVKNCIFGFLLLVFLLYLFLSLYVK